ncbi:MAG: hypothetical protein IT303_13510 [Dehalococcoidia bacterium]|nr:hypothetical protein [Dehalococcoidia bacterium]
MATTTSTLKDEARQVIDELPDDVTVHDLWAAIDAFVVRKKIERGLAESAAGRLIPDEEVWAELGMTA